ncbi:MAG TPA: pseudouridine synthase [Candidatus Omnitrophota bacterium]|nr:pseudouridine synthase [Candidatus Omnitrophota bacterium]
MPQTETVRLQKFMAECGVASRRASEELIREGKVKINGKTVNELGTKVDPQKDKVEVNGSRIGKLEKKIYLKLNKPVGYVSSCKTHGEEKTIMDLVKDIPERLYPIGRLDKDSEGLMLLTNDGELALRLTHPRYEHEKEYLVRTLLPITNPQLDQFRKGMLIESGKTLPARAGREADKVLRIVLKEGKKRQIRKMLETAGNRVLGLKRVRMANIELGGLTAGKYAHLTAEEVRKLTSSMI